jgi:2-keto-4-pentenoate hydratase/2-oxohepta-3-ene-1,7-dioic acid hydratase in catechol pathway
MRYVTFSLTNEPRPRLGVVRNDGAIVELRSPASLLELIQQGPDAWRRVRDEVKNGTSHDAAKVKLLAPIPRPLKNIFCLGLNYASHAVESATARGRDPKIPTNPVFFTKAPTTVSGPFDDIRLDPDVTQQMDWEVELGVIIGVTGRNISKAKALDHVFGYTVINDFTGRDLQAKHTQWFKGKSLDGFCPMGPMVITADEFGDPQARQVSLRVNGVTKQNANTKDMIFPVATIIETLSHGLTLEAGDIISTGTPEGVGMGRTPPEFLKHGDVVETEVEGIGTMRNKIVPA